MSLFLFLSTGAVYMLSFCGLDGASIMESVVLRFGGLLRSGDMLHSPLVLVNESNHGLIPL